MNTHACAAIGCSTQIPKKHLMCGRHWRLVSKPLQDAVYHYYRPGQEMGRRPITKSYRDAAQRAIDYVAGREQKAPPLPFEQVPTT